MWRIFKVFSSDSGRSFRDEIANNGTKDKVYKLEPWFKYVEGSDEYLKLVGMYGHVCDTYFKWRVENNVKETEEFQVKIMSGGYKFNGIANHYVYHYPSLLKDEAVRAMFEKDYQRFMVFLRKLKKANPSRYFELKRIMRLTKPEEKPCPVRDSLNAEIADFWC